MGKAKKNREYASAAGLIPSVASSTELASARRREAGDLSKTAAQTVLGEV